MPEDQTPIEKAEIPLCPKCGTALEEIEGELVCPKCDLEIDYFGEGGDKGEKI
jgi:uncharacterized Zn finger protein (UPF0148 family)